MVYFNLMLISYQEVILLVLLHNIVNIITCHISPIKTNKIPWNHDLPERNRNNVWILSIGRKEPTAVQQVLESISIQLTVKYNKVRVITSRRDKGIVRTNL